MSEAKKLVAGFNDCVRFTDSPPIGLVTRRKRIPEDFGSNVALAPLPQATMEVQQQQGTTADGADAAIAAEGGPGVAAAAAFNENATIAGPVVEGPLHPPPPPREIHLPAQFRDSSVMLLGANATNRIKNTAQNVRATRFKIEQLYNREGTDLTTRFPQFRELLAQVENQFDLVAQLCRHLYDELESACAALRNVEIMVQGFNRVAPDVVTSTFQLLASLEEHRDTLAKSEIIAAEIQSAAAFDPLPADPTEEEEDDDDAEEQDLQPGAPVPQPTAGLIHRLKGNGYLGQLVQVHRIDFVSGSIPAKRSGSDRKRVDGSLPFGKYFLLSEIFFFFDMNVDLNTPPYAKWKSSTVSN